MTRLWIMSDLHLERGRTLFDREPYRPSTNNAHDVIVLAGDITSSPVDTVDYARTTFEKPVICIGGNHEFYGHSIDRMAHHATIRGAHRGVHYLEDRYDDVAGARFYGCTLWSDYDLHGDRMWAMAEASMGVADFTAIPGFTPELARKRQLQSVAALDLMLAEAWDGLRVVVTHHAPSPRSQLPAWTGSRLAPSFTSDLTSMIERWQPDLWIHGHLHDSSDYRIGKTRIVCNPKGYSGENANFRPDLVIEVGK